MAVSTSLDHVRVDQVGSLLRPPALIEAFTREAAGEIGTEQLRQSQDDAIRDVVAKQERLNLPVLTDGEYRRVQFMESFADVAGCPGVRVSR